LEFLKAKFKRDKTYDNRTGEYNEIGEPLIEKRSQGHRTHAIGIEHWRVSVLGVAVHMGVKETGSKQGTRAIQSASKWDEHMFCVGPLVEQSRSISMQ